MFHDIPRANNGDAFLCNSLDFFKLHVNECPTCTHPGKGWYKIKEKLKTLPSSYIVPKGSPLSVSEKNESLHFETAFLLVSLEYTKEHNNMAS